MNQNDIRENSQAWISFSYASFVVALALVASGIMFLPIDIWMRGYLAMGVVMLVQSSVSLTKTLRDQHETRKLINRIEDAKTEQLLMRIDPAKA